MLDRFDRARLQNAALVTAVAATVPYLVLKLMWLAGSTAGVTSDSGLSELHSTRFVAGNAVTVLLMAAAAAFAVALTRPGADRAPAWLVLVLGAGATGLLAPILLGMPIGLVLQVAVTGDVEPSPDTGLAPWVFGIVYSGFGLLGLALAVLAAGYVVRRWQPLLSRPPASPAAPTVVIGAAGLLPFAAAMAWWGLVGVGTTGPQGMEHPAQRTVLVVTGALAAVAFAAPLLGRSSRRRWPRTTWLATWTGCCVAALQGPTMVLLAQDGQVQPVIAAIALLTTPGACLYGLSVLRRHLRLSELVDA